MLLLLGVPSCDSSPVVATVNSEKITLGEFKKFSERKENLLKATSLTPEERQSVLDSLIKRDVVYLYAKKTGVKVPDSAWKEAAQRLPLFDRIKKKKEIEKDLLFEQIRKKMSGNITVTRKEIEDYYRANRREFTQPETYKVYLVQVGEADVRHVLQKLRANPGAFDDMALNRAPEELRGINKNAPYTTKDSFPEEMWSYLERMKAGEIAGPVHVKRGIFLFKLVDKKPASLKPLSESFIEIDHLLSALKREAAFEKWYASVQGDFKIEIKRGYL